eukprot:4151207-Lingulodinium_polyedra.AAC.1
MVHGLQDLGASVDIGKSFAVTGAKRVYVRLARGMGRLAFRRAREAKTLGVGFALGRPATRVAQGRLAAARREGKRLQTLRGVGARPAR